MTNRLALISIHLLVCLAFLMLPYVFAVGGLASVAEVTRNPHERTNLLAYVLMLGFFYLNYYKLIPALLFGKKYVLYVGSVVLGFGLVLLVVISLDRPGTLPALGLTRPDGVGMPPRPPEPPPDERVAPAPGDQPPPFGPPVGEPGRAGAKPFIGFEVSHLFFLFLVGTFVSLSLRINDRWRQTEQAKLQTELSYLKAQINPHFLFNTLNSIYSLAIEQSPATADAIVQLSSFLRYIITEGRQDRVALSHELAYIGHYVALQKLRVEGTVPIQYQAQGNFNGHQIAPLLLISFIENAFKYGVSPQEPSRIDIDIQVTGNRLHCQVFNQKVRVFGPTALSSGIGLSNTKARLQLLYPGQHHLIISDQPDSFTVDLSINLS